MNLRAVARVAGLLGGALLGRPDAARPGRHRQRDRGRAVLGRPGAAVLVALFGVGTTFVSKGAVWLQVIVGIAFPLLVWSVVEVLHPAGDPAVIDAVVGLLVAGAVLLALGQSGGDDGSRRGGTPEHTPAEPPPDVAVRLRECGRPVPGCRRRNRPGGVKVNSAISDRAIERLAMISLHTSPLDQPGTGDAGGMNVYVIELARRLADAGHRGRHLHPGHLLLPCRRSSRPRDGVSVRHIHAGPFEGLTKGELPGQLCVFAREVLRSEAAQPVGHYDVVHSHYWLSGQVGALARDRWGVPLVHSMHTMARVKNDALAAGDTPEPAARIIGEQQVVEAADMLIANTDIEAKQLINLYDADPGRVEVVHPGVDLAVFQPVDEREARRCARPARRRPRADVRRSHPAAQGARRAAARGGRPARGDPVAALPTGGARRRRSVGHRPRAPRVARPAGRRARRRRRRPLRAAGRPVRAGPLVRGRHPGRRTVLQRVVRAGRRRGAGHRYPRHRRPPWAG